MNRIPHFVLVFRAFLIVTYFSVITPLPFVPSCKDTCLHLLIQFCKSMESACPKMAALGINFRVKKWTAKVGNVTIGRSKIESGSVDNNCALCSGDTRFRYWSEHWHKVFVVISNSPEKCRDFTSSHVATSYFRIFHTSSFGNRLIIHCSVLQILLDP